MIPTAWYPSDLAIDPAGRTLFVVNMKGLGVGPVKQGQYVGLLLQGTLSRITVPTAAPTADLHSHRGGQRSLRAGRAGRRR